MDQMGNYLNANLFVQTAVSPETRAINDMLAKLAAETPPMDLTTLRTAFDQGMGPIPATPKSPRARTVMIEGKGGHEIALRVIACANPTGVFLHVHGADMRDADLVRIAENTGLACISVEYRLAPEHPYPAAQDDCEVAAHWIMENAMDLFGTERLMIGGESAGAHLSVATLLRLRDAGHGAAFCAANLCYGLYDLSMTPSQLNADNTLILTRQSLEGGIAAYVPEGMDRRHPYISPLYADLRGLPPALFTVGTLDPLLDDSLFLHARWMAAGNQAQLALYPGGAHGFTTFEGALARKANSLIDEFFIRQVEGR
jgi:acetyl esterase